MRLDEHANDTAAADAAWALDVAKKRQLVQDALSSAALAVSSARGEPLFAELARYLATILDVEGALIAELREPNGPRLHVLAFHLDGATRERFDYPVLGTPCAVVLAQGYHVCESHFDESFPTDEGFIALGIQSYAGFPLKDSHGRPLGVIAVVSRKPLQQPELIGSILKIFAVRASAELEHLRAEERRARLEAQLRQAQRMEAIGQLTGGIAHDFNNLLTSIMGYVVLATERQAAFGDSRLASYLEQAHLSCERARNLIQQMLMFSRGQRGSARPVSLPPLVRQSLTLLRPSLPATLELKVDFQPEVPATRIDPVQLEQVLLNLCINARDVLGGTGTVGIAVQTADVGDGVCASCRKSFSGSFVELRVEDDGPGIPGEVLDRIFEPFFSTKEVGKGTGMGLAITHGIVHEHGGHVIVETAPGKGSRFRVLLPPLGKEEGAEALPRPTGAHTPAAAASLHGNILVVDDEETVGGFMRELLQTWGLRATYVSAPLEALDLIARAPAAFDVVITDQTMPRMTGIALAHAIRAIRADLPIILYTGYGEGVTPDEIREAGIRALLLKPIEPRKLTAALAECLEGRSGAG